MIFLGFKNWGSDLLPPWQILEANLDGCWGFYACKPPLASRTVAVGIPSRLFPFIEKVGCFCCGIGIILKQNSMRTFVVSAHLPHRQRDDCIDTWQSFNSELTSSSSRHSDYSAWQKVMN